MAFAYQLPAHLGCGSMPMALGPVPAGDPATQLQVRLGVLENELWHSKSEAQSAQEANRFLLQSLQASAASGLTSIGESHPTVLELKKQLSCVEQERDDLKARLVSLGVNCDAEQLESSSTAPNAPSTGPVHMNGKRTDSTLERKVSFSLPDSDSKQQHKLAPTGPANLGGDSCRSQHPQTTPPGPPRYFINNQDRTPTEPRTPLPPYNGHANRWQDYAWHGQTRTANAQRHHYTDLDAAQASTKDPPRARALEYGEEPRPEPPSTSKAGRFDRKTLDLLEGRDQSAQKESEDLLIGGPVDKTTSQTSEDKPISPNSEEYIAKIVSSDVGGLLRKMRTQPSRRSSEETVMDEMPTADERRPAQQPATEVFPPRQAETQPRTPKKPVADRFGRPLRSYADLENDESEKSEVDAKGEDVDLTSRKERDHDSQPKANYINCNNERHPQVASKDHGEEASANGSQVPNIKNYSPNHSDKSDSLACSSISEDTPKLYEGPRRPIQMPVSRTQKDDQANQAQIKYSGSYRNEQLDPDEHDTEELDDLAERLAEASFSSRPEEEGSKEGEIVEDGNEKQGVAEAVVKHPVLSFDGDGDGRLAAMSSSYDAELDY